MIRRLFMVASGLSAILFVLAGVTWPRTLRIRDNLTYATADSKTTYAIGTVPGGISIRISRDGSPPAPEFRDVPFLGLSPGWSFESAEWGSSHSFVVSSTSTPTPAVPAPAWSLESARLGNFPSLLVPSESAQIPAGRVISTTVVAVSSSAGLPDRGLLGIRWESTTFAAAPPVYLRSTNVRMTGVAISLWLMMAASAVLPSVWISRWLRVRLRRREGLCLQCGYDVRATPDRCPECGTPVKPVSV